jgi:hypothetical protein
LKYHHEKIQLVKMYVMNLLLNHDSQQVMYFIKRDYKNNTVNWK